MLPSVLVEAAALGLFFWPAGEEGPASGLVGVAAGKPASRMAGAPQLWLLSA